MFGGIGPMELFIVGIIALLLFGKRLPDVAHSLGRSFTSFKEGLRAEPEPTPRPLPVEETAGHLR